MHFNFLYRGQGHRLLIHASLQRQQKNQLADLLLNLQNFLNLCHLWFANISDRCRCPPKTKLSAHKLNFQKQTSDGNTFNQNKTFFKILFSFKTKQKKIRVADYSRRTTLGHKFFQIRTSSNQNNFSWNNSTQFAWSILHRLTQFLDSDPILNTVILQRVPLTQCNQGTLTQLWSMPSYMYNQCQIFKVWCI